MSRRWQDSDIRERSELVTLAEDYLFEYTGDFPYLVEARQAMVTGKLRVPVIRGVLNCMMSDAKVTNMPQPGPVRQFDAGQRRIMFDDSDPLAEPIILPAQLPPPKTVYLNVKWRMTHGVINHKGSKALHLIDPIKSIAKMWTDTGEIRWQIGWSCKSRATYYTPIGGQIFLLRPDQVKTTLRIGCLTMSPAQFNGHEMKGSLVRDWRECKQCLLLADRSSLVESQRTS